MSAPITMKTYGGLTDACLMCLAARGDDFSKEAFRKLDELGVPINNHVIDRVVEKSDLIDDLVRNYLIENPEAKIINIGSGFCTRFYRVDNGLVDWTEIDFDDIGVLWNKIFDTTDRHRFLVKDVTEGLDLEYDLMIVEGMVYHVREKYARAFLKGRVIFDVLWWDRTTPLSTTQYWKFNPDGWKIEIKTRVRVSDKSLGYVILDAEI
jgi:hypothetical protein